MPLHDCAATILPLTHPPIQAHVVANEWLGLPTLCGGISTHMDTPESSPLLRLACALAGRLPL